MSRFFTLLVFLVFSVSYANEVNYHCKNAELYTYTDNKQYQVSEYSLDLTAEKRRRKGYKIRQVLDGRRKTYRKVETRDFTFDHFQTVLGNYIFDMYPRVRPEQVAKVSFLEIEKYKKLGSDDGKGLFVMFDASGEVLGKVFWYGLKFGSCR